jgi:hypothetical protein
MPDAADGLSNYARALESLSETVDALSALDSGTIEALVARAIVEARLEPVARKYVSQNLRASGVGTLSPHYQSTGKLRRAAGSVTVSATYRRGRSLRLEIAMPAGESPYPSSSPGTPPYTVWGALNYGAVRMPEGASLGEKAKRSIKKLASGGTVSRRSREAIARRGVDVRGVSGSRGRGTQIDTSAGEANVLPPRRWFYLTDRQWLDLEARFVDALETVLSGALGGRPPSARTA